MQQTGSTAPKPMKVPGPDHPITIARHPARIVVSLAGQTIADTSDALSLAESTYPAVFYIPRKDVDMALLTSTEHSTYCPYKGEASYFSLPLAGARGENAVWSYESSYPSVQDIKGHLAFYPDRVTIEERPAG
jgi:uncharacterized protein (DUF427 family)